MVDEAQSASREGSLPTRIWRYATGDNVYRNLPARVGYSHAAINDFVSTAADAIDRQATDATVQPSPSSLNAVPGKDGVALDQSKLRSELVSRDRVGQPGEDHGAGPPDGAPGDDRAARLELSDLHHNRPRRVHASALEEPEARQELPDCGRHVGPRDSRGRLHDQRQAGQPVLVRAGRGLGGLARRQGDPARSGGPDQGTLDGLLQRRRNPRHRRDGLDRQLRLPRLRPDADPGRDRRSIRRSRSERRSTSATEGAATDRPPAGVRRVAGESDS